MNDDTAEIEANLENAYQAGIRDGRKMERERIAVAVDSEWFASSSNEYTKGIRDALDRFKRIARTEPS